MFKSRFRPSLEALEAIEAPAVVTWKTLIADAPAATWSDGANWVGGNVPLANDSVVIPENASRINITAAPVTVQDMTIAATNGNTPWVPHINADQALTINGNLTANGVTFHLGSTFTVSTNATVNLGTLSSYFDLNENSTASIVNDGTWTVGGTVTDYGIPITNNGTIRMTPAANASGGIQFSTAMGGPEVFVNYGTVKTESGSGFIKNAQALINSGTLEVKKINNNSSMELSAYQAVSNSGTVIVGDNCTLTAKNLDAQATTADFDSCSGTFTLGQNAKIDTTGLKKFKSYADTFSIAQGVQMKGYVSSIYSTWNFTSELSSLSGNDDWAFLNSNFNIKVKDTGAISTFFTDGKAWLINSTVNVTTIGNNFPAEATYIFFTAQGNVNGDFGYTLGNPLNAHGTDEAGGVVKNLWVGIRQQPPIEEEPLGI